MAYAERIHPPLSRNMLTEELNRIRPALSRDSLPDMRESVMPALSDRLLNAPEATSVPQHHQAQRIPPRPPMPNRTPAPTLQVSSQPMQPTVQPTPRRMPPMLMPVARGQKTALRLQECGCARIRFGFGWDANDSRCDVDASAFLLSENGRVLSDEGFVFYGQQTSSDGSVRFQPSGADDRETITVDTARIDPRIRKIVFVLTIDEALTQKLHFGMLQNVYLRILDDRDGREILSYPLGNAFENVTSMTLGELYLHQGQWKFNPVGNGVHMDLAGQCALYGVTLA